MIKEPLGGAHRDPVETAQNIQKTLLKSLDTLEKVDKDELLEERYSKFRAMGVFKE